MATPEVARPTNQENDMPTLTNYAEHPFHFPAPVGTANPTTGVRPVKTIVVPRASISNDEETGMEKTTPGKVAVSEDELKAMREHHVAKAWFGPTARGGNQIVVEADKPAEKPGKQKD